MPNTREKKLTPRQEEKKREKIVNLQKQKIDNQNRAVNSAWFTVFNRLEFNTMLNSKMRQNICRKNKTLLKFSEIKRILEAHPNLKNLSLNEIKGFNLDAWEAEKVSQAEE